jgi:hypothetical protein
MLERKIASLINGAMKTGYLHIEDENWILIYYSVQKSALMDQTA